MPPSRPRIPRPRGGDFVFACVRCAMLLDDGVEYAWCPVCGTAVDWIDRNLDVWSCAPCDQLIEDVRESPMCPSCLRPMPRLAAPRPIGRAAAPQPVVGIATVVRRLAISIVVVQAILALAAPDAFPYLRGWLIAAQAIAVSVIACVLGLSRAIHALARDRRTRILHGLEHATIAVLADRGIAVSWGRTYRGEFVLGLVNDGRAWDRLDEIYAAATDAIRRVARGEHALAYTVDCGTSRLVGHLLLWLAIAGAGIAALAFDVSTAVTFAATVAAVLLALALRGRVGLAAQRWLTVSTDLATAAIQAIEQRASSDGDEVLITVAIDVVPRARTGGAVAPTVLG